MTIVSQLLRIKGHDVWSINPDASIFDALKMMSDMNIGAMLVLDEGEVAGIFSERDYARRVVLRGKSSRKTAVKDAMTAEVVSVRPDQTIEDCMTLMTDKHFRHLPVITAEGELVGIISIGDVVKALLSEQETVINHLEEYIRS
ncbi:MAG: CBS domain-containing protein [Chloroflexi bacterium]|nr:CBS domain-containing protein [Chloroflexota bacterium]